MPRALKRLKITEVSSVPAGANPGARVLIMKRDAPPAQRPKPRRRNLYEIMADAKTRAEANGAKPKMKALIAVAKNVLAGNPTVHTRDDFFEALQRGAAKVRRKNETPEQSFSRFATETEDGRLLLKAMKAAPGPDGGPTLLTGVPTDMTPAYQRMMAEARALMRSNPGLTEAAAFSRVYNDPEFANLTAADKQYHRTRATAAAAPLAGSTGPGLKPDQQPDYEKAHKKLLKRAKKLRKRSPGLSAEGAFLETVSAPENAGLVARYKRAAA